MSVMICESYIIGLWITKAFLRSEGISRDLSLGRFQLVFLTTIFFLFLYLSGVIFASRFTLSIASNFYLNLGWTFSILFFTIPAGLLFRYVEEFSIITSVLCFVFYTIFSVYLLYDCNLMAFEKVIILRDTIQTPMIA